MQRRPPIRLRLTTPAALPPEHSRRGIAQLMSSAATSSLSGTGTITSPTATTRATSSVLPGSAESAPHHVLGVKGDGAVGMESESPDEEQVVIYEEMHGHHEAVMDDANQMRSKVVRLCAEVAKLKDGLVNSTLARLAAEKDAANAQICLRSMSEKLGVAEKRLHHQCSQRAITHGAAAKMESELSEARKVKSRLEGELNEARKAAEENKALLAQHSSQIKQLQSENAALGAESKVKGDQLGAIGEQLKKTSVEAARLRAESENTSRREAAMGGQITLLNTEVIQLQDEIIGLKTKLSAKTIEARDVREAAGTAKSRWESEIANAEKVRKTMEEEIKALRDKHSAEGKDHIDEIARLRSAFGDIRVELVNAYQRIGATLAAASDGPTTPDGSVPSTSSSEYGLAGLVQTTERVRREPEIRGAIGTVPYLTRLQVRAMDAPKAKRQRNEADYARVQALYLSESIQDATVVRSFFAIWLSKASGAKKQLPEFIVVSDLLFRAYLLVRSGQCATQIDASLLYPSVIVRFVKMVKEPSAPRTVRWPPAANAELPRWVVTVRNHICHEEMPAEEEMRRTVDYIHHWLWGYYWSYPYVQLSTFHEAPKPAKERQQRPMQDPPLPSTLPLATIKRKKRGTKELFLQRAQSNSELEPVEEFPPASMTLERQARPDRGFQTPPMKRRRMESGQESPSQPAEEPSQSCSVDADETATLPRSALQASADGDSSGENSLPAQASQGSGGSGSSNSDADSSKEDASIKDSKTSPSSTQQVVGVEDSPEYDSKTVDEDEMELDEEESSEGDEDRSLLNVALRGYLTWRMDHRESVELSSSKSFKNLTDCIDRNADQFLRAIIEVCLSHPVCCSNEVGGDLSITRISTAEQKLYLPLLTLVAEAGLLSDLLILTIRELVNDGTDEEQHGYGMRRRLSLAGWMDLLLDAFLAMPETSRDGGRDVAVGGQLSGEELGHILEAMEKAMVYFRDDKILRAIIHHRQLTSSSLNKGSVVLSVMEDK